MESAQFTTARMTRLVILRLQTVLKIGVGRRLQRKGNDVITTHHLSVKFMRVGEHTSVPALGGDFGDDNDMA
jgi:hypothetical protein